MGRITTIFSPDNRRFSTLLASAHLLVIGAALSIHHMWRDELEAWLLATTTSFGQLYTDLAYTGHTSLWYLVLRAAHMFGGGPWVMQVVNAFFSTAGIYLVARFAPFSRLQKVLFAFGYFTAFEYGVISRDYALVTFLLTLFCVIATRPRPRPVLLAVITGLICHTNTHGTIIVLPLAALGILRGVRQISSSHSRPRATWLGLASTGIVALSLLSALWLEKAPADSSYRSGVASTFDDRLHNFPTRQAFDQSCSFLIKGLMPLPAPQLEFINTSYFVPGTREFFIASIFVLGVLALTVTCLPWKNALLFALTTAGLLAFFHLIYQGFMRHYGFLYVALWTSRWLGLPDRPSVRGRILSVTFTLVLICQAVAGAVAQRYHARAPFSQGKNTADFLRKQKLDALPIAGDIDFVCVTVAGYLGRPIYYPRAGYEGYYVLFNLQRTRPVNEDEILRRVADRFRGQPRVILLLTYPLNGALANRYHVQGLATFQDAITPDENFYVYSVSFS